MNTCLAASRPSLFVSHVTIPPFDFTSFTTDHQQTWLPQPPSSAQATATARNSFNQDFPLFGTAPDNTPRPPQHSRAQATLITAPNQTTQGLRVRQPPQLQSISNGNFSTSTNNRSFSSPTLFNQQQHNARQRPPIPLFTDTVNTPQNQVALSRRRIQSASSSIPQQEGNSSIDPSHEPILNHNPDTDMSAHFDNMYLPGDYSAEDENMFGFGYSDSAFTAINGNGSSAATQSPATPQTVSPQEIYMSSSIAMSAPSSTAFPNLSTPGSGYLESPFMAESSSLDTSPMIDGALDSTLNFNDFSSAPLFPQDGSDLYAQSNKAQTSFTSTSTNLSGASPLVRQTSSPGRPATAGSGHARKPSTVAGVKPSKARKALDPIMITQEDSREDAKRKKNTAAARKSRQKRQETTDMLLIEVQRLRGLVETLGGDPGDGVLVE